MNDIQRFYARSMALFGQGPESLFLNPPADPALFRPSGNQAPPTLFSQSFGDARTLRAAGLEAEFATFPAQAVPGWKDIVLRLPREKALLRIWLEWCAGALAPGGRLWLAGENRAGAKSAGKLLAERFATVQKSDSARHCTLYQAGQPQGAEPFDEESCFQQWPFEARGRSFSASSMPGVFSHGRLDAGSRLLLESLDPGRMAGKVLDFGAGAGVIAVVLKALNPDLALTLADNSALALAASRRSLALNGLQGEVLASDGLSEVKGRFDWVISNPPFHQGAATQAGMSMAMLNTIRNFLTPRGQLVMVANRHLPYRTWLDGLFGRHDVLAADSQYQVLTARQSPATSKE
jgi:16S rRNA (guanine1207-N2)-methyltransferase